MKNAKRIFVIGDIHGCAEELTSLLKSADLDPSDEIISVGDMIGKGPDSQAVLKWAMEQSNLRCVLGNHEARFLKKWEQGRIDEILDRATVDQFGGDFDRFMRYIRTWPRYIETEHGLIVHAGIDPREPRLERQDPTDLINIRELKDLEIPWFEAYTEDRLIVFGHWAQRQLVVRKNAIGLDTGCVYGGALTGLFLPERRLIQVPARREYRKKESWPKPS